MVANAVQRSINALLKQQIANRYGKLAKSKNLSNLRQTMLDKANTVKLFDEYATKSPDIFTKDLQLAEDDLRKAHATWYKNKTIEDKLKDLANRGYVPENIDTEPRKIKTQAKLRKLNDDVQELIKKYEFTDERYLSQENPAYINDMQRHIDNSSELSKVEKENLTKRLNTNKSFEKSGEYDINTQTSEKRSKDIDRLTTQFLKSIENKTTREKPEINFHKFYKLLKEKTSDKTTINKALDAFRKQTQTKQSSLLDTLKEVASGDTFPVKSVLKDIKGQDFQNLLKKLNIRNYKGLRGARSLFDILKAKNRTPTQDLFISKYNDLISKPAHNPANKKADYDMLRWRNQHRPEIVDLIEDAEGNVSYKLKPHISEENDILSDTTTKADYQDFLDRVRMMYGD